jgi:hypothetical protein
MTPEEDPINHAIDDLIDEGTSMPASYLQFTQIDCACIMHRHGFIVPLRETTCL